MNKQNSAFGKVNYIGGTDTLPPPLSKEELDEIFEKIENACGFCGLQAVLL